MSLPITPNALRLIRKLERETWAEYADARRSALSVCAEVRRGEISIIAREQALAHAWEARRWARLATERRIAAEARPCVPGSAWSPAACERLRARGRLK